MPCHCFRGFRVLIINEKRKYKSEKIVTNNWKKMRIVKNLCMNERFPTLNVIQCFLKFFINRSSSRSLTLLEIIISG